MQHIQNKQFPLVEGGIIDFIDMNSQKSNYIKLAVPAGNLLSNRVAYEQQCVNSIGAYANIIVQLFCHPQYSPSNKILDTFLFQKETLELIFSLSAWQTTDPIIEKLALLEETKTKKSQLSKRRRLRLNALLSLICLNSKHTLPWPHMFELVPKLACLTYLSLLSQTISTLAPGKDEKFSNLLSKAKDLPIVTIDEFIANFALNAYFYSSYTIGKDKYEIKKWLAKLLKANVKQFLTEDVCDHIEKCKNNTIPDKPKIGIVLEVFHRQHAMYRCFNLLLRELGEQYNTIAFLDNEETHDIDISAFDGAKYFNLNNSINQRAQLIKEEHCDVLFYPSIGLKSWGFILASLRLAPLQFMMGGHPSSTYNDAIDYFIIRRNSFSKEDIQTYIHEKVIMINDSNNIENFATRHSVLTDEFVEKNDKFLDSDDEIVIGINGVIRKVSSETISLCQEIHERAAKPVRFVFFSLHPDAHLAYLATKINLLRLLPNIDLISYSDYPSYLEQLSRCHFLLPTLPFGGSNSNIDAMVLKKPKLCLRQQKELYTRTDAIEWDSMSLDDLMVCDTKENMIAKSLTLINSKEIRFEYYEAMNRKCQLDQIFNSSDVEHKDPINQHVQVLLEDFRSRTSAVLETAEIC